MSFADTKNEKDAAGQASALDFEMKTIDGKTVDLEDYKGKVVMIVNVASRCGLTRQYTQLQEIFEKYEGKGFVVLGFPCNQFGGQEPGSEADIKEFCSSKYQVKFPMFSKIEVNGKGATDLYKYLTAKKLKPAGSGKISWNFEKFVINREGEVVARFAPPTKPDADEVIAVIERELQKKS
ncbi:MAG: glutathione peroxidase [Planctomycetota bacterium]